MLPAGVYALWIINVHERLYVVRARQAVNTISRDIHQGEKYYSMRQLKSFISSNRAYKGRFHVGLIQYTNMSSMSRISAAGNSKQ